MFEAPSPPTSQRARILPARITWRLDMAKKAKAKRTTRGRSQDRAKVAGRQDYEVGYTAKKTGKSRKAVKKAVKKVGSSRKKVERALGRRR
jgi:hypothetical protein